MSFFTLALIVIAAATNSTLILSAAVATILVSISWKKINSK